MSDQISKHLDGKLDVKSSASYVDKSPSYLNKKRSTGGGPKYLKIGYKIYYRTSDLDSWLAERIEECTSTAQGGEGYEQ